MSDLIPWYLVELRTRLSPFLDAKLVETIVGETKSHLNESVAKLESEQQIGADQATSTAVDAYGSPERVALAHLKEHAWRPLGIQPIWLVVGGAFVSTTCWMLHWQWLSGYFDNFGETWENGVALALSLAATIVFAIGCYAGRRRFRAATLAICVAMMVGVPFLYSFLLVGSSLGYQSLNRLHLSRDVATVNRTMATLDRMSAYSANAVRIFAAVKSPADVPPEYSQPLEATQAIGGFPTRERAIAARFNEITINPPDQVNTLPAGAAYDSIPHFIVPTESAFADAMVDGRIWTGLQEETDFSHAKYLWRTRAAKLEGQIGSEKGRLTGLLNAAAEARAGRLFFFNPGKYDQQVEGSIPVFMIFLLIVEAATFILVRRRRRRPEFVTA